ncbi:MAG: CinA family protein [Candidatus Omnitrophica bacterium]|nr:CinA family protein [Candidatus Omnitrophota bacterium]
MKIAHKLITREWTVCLAESCTGGLLAHTLTNIPGSSAFFTASLVCYANKAKTKLLGIPEALIKERGAVSLPVAQLMATNAAHLFNSDFSIGITGIAGPGGGTRLKPVGLVFIAVRSREKLLTKRYIFKGSRLQIKRQACDKALKLLLSAMDH